MFFSPDHSLLTFAIKAYNIKKNVFCQGEAAFAVLLYVKIIYNLLRRSP
jgi:hypothetical protein